MSARNEAHRVEELAVRDNQTACAEFAPYVTHREFELLPLWDGRCETKSETPLAEPASVACGPLRGPPQRHVDELDCRAVTRSHFYAVDRNAMALGQFRHTPLDIARQPKIARKRCRPSSVTDQGRARFACSGDRRQIGAITAEADQEPIAVMRSAGDIARKQPRIVAGAHVANLVGGQD